MEVPESCSKSHIEVILSSSSTKYIRGDLKSFHSADGIFYNNSNTGYKIILFFLLLCERMLLAGFLRDIGILMDMLYSLKSTIYEKIYFIWKRRENRSFIQLFFIMKFPVFCGREISYLSCFVSDDGIFSSWSLFLS